VNDVILVGGPRGGEVVPSEGEALVEVEIDGMLHRYIKTNAERDGYRVYNYDGMVDPTGAQSGVENAEARLASPAAHREEH
jgi:hypothetical protein